MCKEKRSTYVREILVKKVVKIDEDLSSEIINICVDSNDLETLVILLSSESITITKVNQSELFSKCARNNNKDMFFLLMDKFGYGQNSIGKTGKKIKSVFKLNKSQIDFAKIEVFDSYLESIKLGSWGIFKWLHCNLFEEMDLLVSTKKKDILLTVERYASDRIKTLFKKKIN
jgi:hypothetical protein